MAPSPTDSPVAARFLASPNHGERRAPFEPNALILHYTGMASAERALAWLRDPKSEVSSHYVVHEDGEVLQLVRESARAWHAGAGVWKGEHDLNSTSIGIEIANPGHDGGLPPFPQQQIDAVIALARDVCARRGIRPERVLAHSDIAPRRKRDPGERFPWDRLAAAGVGHWTEPVALNGDPILAAQEEGPHVRALQAMFSLYGYGIEITGVNDAQTKIVAAAFQRHFRPARVDGEIDASTIQTLKALLDALPPR